MKNKTVDILINPVPLSDYRERGFCGYDIVCRQVVSFEGVHIISSFTKIYDTNSQKCTVENRYISMHSITIR